MISFTSFHGITHLTAAQESEPALHRWSETSQHRRPTSYHSVSLEPPVCLGILQGMIPIWKKTFQTVKVPFSGSVDASAFRRHIFTPSSFDSFRSEWSRALPKAA